MNRKKIEREIRACQQGVGREAESAAGFESSPAVMAALWGAGIALAWLIGWEQAPSSAIPRKLHERELAERRAIANAREAAAAAPEKTPGGGDGALPKP